MINERDLPSAAQAKLRSLRQATLDADALMARARESALDAEKLVSACTNQRDTASTKQGRKQADQALADATMELNELRTQLDARFRRVQDGRRTLTQVAAWLQTQPAGASVASVPVSAPMPDDLRGAVEEVRRTIASKQADHHRLRTAPPSEADLKSIAARMSVDLAEAGRPVIASAAGNIELRWRRGDSFHTPPRPKEVAAMLAWLWPDQMREAIERELLDRLTPEPHGVDAEERHAQMRVLEDEVLFLERVEEHLAAEAIKRGLEMFRRPDADPRAVLGIGLA